MPLGLAADESSEDNKGVPVIDEDVSETEPVGQESPARESPEQSVGFADPQVDQSSSGLVIDSNDPSMDRKLHEFMDPGLANSSAKPKSAEAKAASAKAASSLKPSSQAES